MLLLGILLLVGREAAAAVTGCRDPEGNLVFTQFGCPPGTRAAPEDRGPAGRLSIIESTPLTPAELEELDRLERELSRSRAQRAKQRRASDRARSAAKTEARARCRQAEAGLNALAAKRRRGYSVAEDRRFDAEEARLREERRATC